MNKKGFTLIELLVVIAIIGLLSSLVVVSVSSARAKARDARRKQDLHQVQLAMQLYYNQYNKYPKVTELDKNIIPPVAKPKFSLINTAQAFVTSCGTSYPNSSCSKSVGPCLDACYPGVTPPENGGNAAVLEFLNPFPKDPLNDDIHYYRFNAKDDQSFCFIIESLEAENTALYITQNTSGKMTAGLLDCPAGSY